MSATKELTLPLQVEVTQADLDEARCKQRAESYVICSECMMAVALERTTGHDWEVGSLFAQTWLSEKVKATIYLPGIAMKNIREFDLRRNVEPFSCECALSNLDVLCKTLEEAHEEIRNLFPAAVFDGERASIDGQLRTFYQDFGWYGLS